MEKWKIFNLMPTFAALILAFIAGYLLFNIDILLSKLFGVISLSIAVIIQMYVSHMIYVRDVSILKELKNCEGRIEITREDIKKIPSYIEGNNSKLDGYIKANNSDICKYIDYKISQVIKAIEDRYRK